MYIDGMSDNFKAFKEARSLGKSPQDAAFITWTGKQVTKAGYKNVKVITENDKLILIEFTK